MLAKQRTWIVMALLAIIVFAALSWAARLNSVSLAPLAAEETATPTETPEPATARLPDFVLTAPVASAVPDNGPGAPPPNPLTPIWTSTPQPVTSTPW